MGMESGISAFPRAVRLGSTVELIVQAANGKAFFGKTRDFTVRFFSKVDRSDDAKQDVCLDDSGVLRVKVAFREPGEYTLEIRVRGSEEVLASSTFYAVKPELAGLWPFKGDTHMHTTGSDGKNTVVEMLARSRELGMDFVAVTDHDNFDPSCQGVQDAASLGSGLLVLKGEEITIREIGGHVLALNTSIAVGGRRRFTPVTEGETAEIARSLAGRKLASPLTAETYAFAVWTMKNVRAAGGIAAMAHPCWEGSKGKYYPPRCVFEQLLADGWIDAIELVGGSPSTEGNLLCVARFADELERGRRLPILGGSDAHAVAELGRKFTLIFADRLTEDAIIRAILDKRSVACDTGLGPDVAVFGSFDWVEYAYFLLRVYFPLHDRLCADAARTGADLQSELDELRKRFWH
jgi:hypothetical protein